MLNFGHIGRIVKFPRTIIISQIAKLSEKNPAKRKSQDKIEMLFDIFREAAAEKKWNKAKNTLKAIKRAEIRYKNKYDKKYGTEYQHLKREYEYWKSKK